MLMYKFVGVESFTFHMEAMNAQEGTSRMGITVEVLPHANPCDLETKVYTSVDVNRIR